LVTADVSAESIPECRSETGHPGDCTIIDPITNKAVQVGRSASKW
jgi:hypothetical protein